MTVSASKTEPIVEQLAAYEDAEEQGRGCRHNLGDHCTVLSDAEVKQPCIEGPCPEYVPVVCGTWLELGFAPGEPYGFICSVCHADVVATRLYPIADIKYCPNCGAKMDGTPDER